MDVGELLPRILEWIKKTCKRPIIVGISAAQGGGKTTIARRLVSILREDHQVQAVSFSLDDFYYDHASLGRLQEANPSNKLLHGRGLAGTHDLPLLYKVLDQLVRSEYPVVIPKYNKSCHNGEGDRAPSSEATVVREAVDLVFCDGWMLGFTVDLSQDVRGQVRDHVDGALVEQFGLENIVTTYQNLEKYLPLHTKLDHFIHMWHPNPEISRVWRAQQEEESIRENKSGMNPEQVQKFIERYVPFYQLCTERLSCQRLWKDKWPNRHHVRATLDDQRRFVEIVEVLE